MGQFCAEVRDCAIITWRGGTKSYPPLIKQKLISTPPPHIMIILRLTPLEKSLLPLIPSYLVYFFEA